MENVWFFCVLGGALTTNNLEFRGVLDPVSKSKNPAPIAFSTNCFDRDHGHGYNLTSYLPYELSD